MTNQEAIEFLKNMIDREAIGFVCPEREGDVAIWQYHVEALQMAISALQAQEAKAQLSAEGTTSDLISRQKAIDALCSDCQGRCIPCESYPCSEVEAINALPSAHPESQKRTEEFAQNVPKEDLISRKAAIDAISNWLYDTQTTETSDEVLLKLPSAQPEIIRCKDCKHAIKDGLCGGYWCNGKAVTSNHYCGYAERRDDGCKDR